jgi:hypothetical protein
MMDRITRRDGGTSDCRVLRANPDENARNLIRLGSLAEFFSHLRSSGTEQGRDQLSLLRERGEPCVSSLSECDTEEIWRALRHSHRRRLSYHAPPR